jgi:2-polyprenyl-6-hydroxyphenyl methylase/3-demethylubiquinone-9 3-methyltransferase
MEVRARAPKPVNNTIYSTLGDRWYAAQDDPVALLRAEARFRNPWVSRKIEARHGSRSCSVLDIGCGGGFLSNHLAALGHRVTGLDEAEDSLQVAAAHDWTKTASYVRGDALHLPFGDGAFDVVCAMDFLEHVEEPDRAIAEAARVLAPGGLFFFHTFNRNLLSWLVVIKGVEWFVKNTPPDMHVLRLFVKPRELEASCERHGLRVTEWIGSRPRLGKAFLELLRTHVVPKDFEFTSSPSTLLGYSGVARKGPP